MTSPAMYIPSDQDRKFAEASTERARLQAAAYLPQLLDIVAEKALDPGATPKSVLDAAEFAYKVSGLAKRQEDKGQTGATIIFNLSGGKTLEVSTKPSQTAAPTPQTVEQDILDIVPSYVSSMEAHSDDFDLDLGDFDDE
jgi:hypothetical protein